MPKATVASDVIHKELKTCPGGYVDIKQLAYYDMLKRSDNATRMSMEAGGDVKSAETRKIAIEFMNQWTTEFDFANCIDDHNLNDEEGKKLDLSNPMTLKILDPRIGAEIARYIMELNQEVDDVEDFTKSSTSSSSDEVNTQELGMETIS